jgi:ankyrin repeat protein
MSLGVVKVLLEHRCGVYDMNDYSTPLYIAMFRKRYAIMNELSRIPGYMNIQSIDGQTVLFAASRLQEPRMVEFALSLGCDPTIADAKGAIPLMLAEDAETLRLLVEAAPATMHRRDNRGRTVLMELCWKESAEQCMTELFECSERYGAVIDVNAKTNKGETALSVAMCAENIVAVKLLLEKGADVMGCGYGGTTALMKPFLGAQECLEVFDAEVDDEPENEQEVDAINSYCLKMILNEVMLRSNPVTRWAVRRERGGEGGEPPAKRRRMESR